MGHASDPATMSDWVAMDTIQFYVIQTGLFSETISFWRLVVPLNNFASISNCLWMQGKSKKPPPPIVCLWGGYSFHDLTSIFSFINIHEYANEIIKCMTIGRKVLTNRITQMI